MARDIDPSSAASNPVAANSDNAFIDKASSTNLAVPPTPDPTMAGRVRFEQILRTGPGEPGGDRWDTWLLSLPEDANDLEYTRSLRDAKAFAQLRQTERGQAQGRADSKVPALDDPNAKPRTADSIWRQRLRGLGINLPEPDASDAKNGGGASALLKTDSSTGTAGSPPFPWSPPSTPTPGPVSATALLSTDSTSGPAGSLPFAWPPDGIRTANPDTAHQQDRVQKELDARDEGVNRANNERKYREKLGDKPIIMGLQVSDNEALTGGSTPDNPGGTPDGYISEWAHKQGLSLDNEHAQRAARNGSWVYQGEVADPNGGPGFTRSVYVHLDDAISQVSGLSMDQIKSYQRMMKNPETGIVDAELQSLWKEAVARGSDYARQGKKVTLDFIFQQLLAAKVKGGGRGGGGGGGSGPFGNESGADMVGANYYQAMMQILGDISGVK